MAETQMSQKEYDEMIRKREKERAELDKQRRANSGQPEEEIELIEDEDRDPNESLYEKEKSPGVVAKLKSYFGKRTAAQLQEDRERKRESEERKERKREYKEQEKYEKTINRNPSKFREDITKAGKIIAPKIKSGAIKTGSLLKKAGKASAPILKSAGKAVAGGIERVGKNMEQAERKQPKRSYREEEEKPRKRYREPEDDELMFTPFRGHREEESRPRRNVAPPDTDFFGLTQRSGRSIKEEYTARPFSMSRPDSSSPFTFGSRQVSPQSSGKIVSMGAMPPIIPRGTSRSPARTVKTKFIKKTTIKSGNRPKNPPKGSNKRVQQNPTKQSPRQTREPSRQQRRTRNDDDMIWGM